jgi:hypothetical protein
VAAEPAAVLPETAGVPWRPRVDDARLRRFAAAWTATTLAHVVPFLGVGVLLLALDLRTLPVALAAWAHAWLIPEVYARRGADSIRVKRKRRAPTADAERTALGLLGDLVGHEAREVLQATGLVVERGRLGVWVVGEAGALLVRGGRRGRWQRVHCWCVRVKDPALPTGDRIAHLLLALRTDEAGFATVANQTFSGARWRVRRRMPEPMRPALDAAGAIAATDRRYSAAA